MTNLTDRINTLPPYKRDAILILFKMGIMAGLFIISEGLNHLGALVGMPWAILFYIPSLIVIGTMFYLLFLIWTSIMKSWDRGS